ncbi:hypothetical protein AgCh_010609 [Apium graveolens]
MSLEQSNNFIVRFNGKNYSAWSFQFEILVKGKELWGYVDRTVSASTTKKMNLRNGRGEGREGWREKIVDPVLFPATVVASSWRRRPMGADTDSELAAADLLKSGSGVRFTQTNTLFHRFTIFVMSSALSLRSILDAHKLTGPNFAGWLRNLRIVLRVEKLEYVLDSPKPTEPASSAHNDEHVVYRKWIDDANVAQCIMLASMNIELQKQHEHMDAHTILMHLQELYDVAGRTARYEISKELFSCRMSEGSSMNDHKSSVLLIGEGSNPKKRKKNPSKKKKVGEKKPVPPKAEDPKSKAICFHCNKAGHWKRNCKVYLAELKKKKGSETTASDSGIFMIEVNMSLSQISTWVLDTACGSHICNLLQGLRRSRTLEEEEEGLLDPFDFESYPTCESCLLGKMTKSPFSGHGERAADLLGLMIDLDSDMCMMKHKSEAFEKFKEYKYEVEKQTKHSIITLRSDRGGECLNGEFLAYLKKNGIVSQWTPSYTPQLNGVPSKSVPQTPYEISKERKPSLKHVKIWGCPAYVKKGDPDKLESRSVKCNFVGYPKETLGHYFYTDHRVFVSRHATFLEKQFILEGNSGTKIELDEVQKAQTTTDQVETPVQTEQPSVEQPIRRSGRVSRQPERYYGLVIENDNELSIIDDDDPVTYNEVMSSVDLEKWHSAMTSEMESMYINQVWTLVEAPEGVKPIGCKWVYKRKIGADGQVETYKARLVAKGFRQRQGIDFDETFLHVALLKSIRILLAIAAYYDYEIWQMDVKTTFLNGKLEEEVYMIQPKGFLSKGNEHLVCKLVRTIYGLKQASRRWNIRFDETIKEFGFIKNIDEPRVYKKVSGNAVTFLVLY